MLNQLRCIRAERALFTLFASATLTAAMLVTSPARAAPVTYEQILAAPDDAQLNLTYARQQVATGRLQQAAAALERLLLQRPNWDSVRLFYGIVLYRLDDLSGAIRELEILEGRGLNPDQEADRVKYLARAVKKSQPLRITSRFSLGGRYDTNPGRVSDAVTASTGADSDSDFAFAARSRFRIEADLNNGRRDYLFVQTNGHLREFFDIDRADLIHSRARAGAKLHFQDGSITPYGSYSSVWLQQERFRTSFGGGLDASWTLNSQVTLMLNAESIYQDYETTSYSAVGDLRDGWKYGGGFKFRWRPSDSMTVYAGADFKTKEAESDGFSYDSGKLSLAAQKLLGMGRYVTMAASFARTEYDQPDTFYSNTITREDDVFRVRASTGAPLSTILAGIDLPDQLGGIVAQVGATYHQQNSSIEDLDIDNFSVDLMFIKRTTF